MNDGERLERLLGWFKVIDGELGDLILDDYLFWQVQEVVRSNPHFADSPGLFTQWIASCFIQSAASSVRRQLKLDRDSISLRRLLEELRQYPHLISRDFYLAHFKDSPEWLQEHGDQEFDDWAGKGGLHISPAIVESHILDLKAAGAAIEAYADRRVAHYDQRGLAGPAPTFDDLSKCLVVLQGIFKKYHVLLRGASPESLLPTIVVDWKQIFRFAWVTS
jgi:hypothetical protein